MVSGLERKIKTYGALEEVEFDEPTYRVLEPINIPNKYNEAPTLSYQLKVEREPKFVTRTTQEVIREHYQGSELTVNELIKKYKISNEDILKWTEQQNQNETDFDPKYVVIRDPLTVDFDVQRYPYSGNANTSIVKVYNLSDSTRFSLQKISRTSDKFRKVEFRAGVLNDKIADDDAQYEALPLVARGYLIRAYSIKDKTDIITILEFCGNAEIQLASFYAGKTDLTSGFNTTRQQVIEGILKQFPGLEGAYIGDTDPNLKRVIANRPLIKGRDVFRSINDLLGSSTFFIDNLIPHVMSADDYVGDGQAINVISSVTGLISTPIVEQGQMQFDILFEPRIVMCQVVTLKSSIFVGISDSPCKVIGIKHTGIISGAQSSRCVTSLTLLNSPDILKQFIGTIPSKGNSLGALNL